MLNLLPLGRNVKKTITKIILVKQSHQKPSQITFLLPKKMWKPLIMSQMIVTYQKPERKKQKTTEK